MNKDNKQKLKFLTLRKILLGGMVLVLLLVAALALKLPAQQKVEPTSISLSMAVDDLRLGKITKIEDVLLTGEMRLHYQSGEVKESQRDPQSGLLEQLGLLGLASENLSQVQIEVIKAPASLGSTPAGALLTILLLGIPFGAVFYISRRDRVSRKTFRAIDIPSIGFSAVAGIDENLPELQDIVTFLKEGNKYSELGARMPRGILMVGEPGTGKTLLAKALAGEAGVPFFATSGSEFVEVFVGVGASRMRTLFQKARKHAPCIVFIDEIDAVGRSRHRSESGAEMEQDQTLNQLLVEMDGFGSTEGVVVLAATNRVDVLDSALTRPGRFDRRIHVNRPDVKGREAILEVHALGKKISQNVSLATVARATPGLVGADLANVVNEAAINAVRCSRTEIEMQDFEVAVEKIITGGVPRKSQVMSEEERRIIAYHEAGHAVVMHETRLSDPVYKITIIPRGQMGGFTLSLPEQDRMLMSRCKILAQITGLLGGRAAEEIFFQDVTNGASNDLSVATQYAEEMVMRLGMAPEAGLRVIPQQARTLFGQQQNSQKTFETIDEAVNNILTSCYEDARRILIEKRGRIERVAQELLDIETVDRMRFLELMNEAEAPLPVL